MLALAALLAQMTAQEIHAEDAEVIEAALVHFWTKNKPESKIIDVVNRTSGSIQNLDQMMQWGGKEKTLVVDPESRENLVARNPFPISLAWFQPKSNMLRAVPPRSGAAPWTRIVRQQYTYLRMPGYSKDRTKSLVTLRFNWSIHSGDGIVVLSKEGRVWKVVDSRVIYYV